MRFRKHRCAIALVICITIVSCWRYAIQQVCAAAPDQLRKKEHATSSSVTPTATLPQGLVHEITYLRKLIGRRPKDEEARLRLAVLLMRVNEWDEAESLLKSVERENPQSLSAQKGLAELYSLIGFVDLEMHSLEKQIAIEPRAQGALLRLSAIYLELRRFPEAKATLAKAKRFTIDSPDIHLAEANYYYALTRNQEAVKAARTATERFPHDSHSFQVLSNLYLESKRFDDALNTIDQAIRLQPSAPEYRRLRGEILVQRGGSEDYRQAIDILKGILVSSTNDISARFSLGVAYSRLGKTKDAIRELEQVAKVRTQNASIVFELANLQMKEGNKKRGQELMKEYHEIRQLGNILRRARFQLWTHPNDPKVHFDAARAYVAIGNTPSAIAELQRVLELDPSHPQAKQRLRELYALTGRSENSLQNK